MSTAAPRQPISYGHTPLDVVASMSGIDFLLRIFRAGRLLAHATSTCLVFEAEAS